MKKTTTVIIGAGQSGLAFSNELSARSVDHVVLERGKVANSWRTERWDSLRLLTPNWQSRLPGFAYRGEDPDGYMTAGDVACFLDDYASVAAAPVTTGAEVLALAGYDGGYRIETTVGDWHCRSVVVATGACALASVPSACGRLAGRCRKPDANSSTRTRGSSKTAAFSIVGASASGAQLAQEIQASGRQVTLSTGEHVRLPRVYRGRDICWWMDSIGLMDTHYREVDDLKRARKVASLQLMGSDDRSNIDLNTLQDCGIRVVGRLQGLRDGAALLSGALRNHCMLADLKMNRLLDTIDEWVLASGRSGEFDPAHRFDETRLADDTPLSLDLAGESIRSVIWATGYRPDYSWLNLPVSGPQGSDPSRGRDRHRRWRALRHGPAVHAAAQIILH